MVKFVHLVLVRVASRGRGMLYLDQKKIANLAKLEYTALDITGKNYLTWVLDTKIYLEAGNLGDTIREESSSSSQDREKAMIFIRCHLDEALKSEYLTVEDQLALWEALRSKYNHQTTVILPKAHYEWSHLRIQDFKLVAEYNYALFSITFQMKLCGDTITEEMLLEKTYNTFHANNMILQQQYRARGQLDTTHLDVSDFIMEMGNELYQSD
nr:uncharacterized protein LOC103443767 [Malus domestica]